MHFPKEYGMIYHITSSQQLYYQLYVLELSMGLETRLGLQGDLWPGIHRHKRSTLIHGSHIINSLQSHFIIKLTWRD